MAGDVKSLALLWVGLFLNLASDIVYYFSGGSSSLFLIWLLGLILIALAFKNKDQFAFGYDKWDFKAVVWLVCIFVPLYFVSIYTSPYQINTDEVTIMLGGSTSHAGDFKK